MTIAILFAVLVLLIAGVAFFAASETAFLSLNKVHLKSLVRAKARGAKAAMKLWMDMDNLLSLVLIGTNFLDAAAASISTALAMRIAGGGAVFIATLITTAAITVFGEIVPKTFARANTDKTAFFAAPALLAMGRVLLPVTMLFSLISKAVNAAAKHLLPEREGAITEADIKMMLDVGAAEGTLEKSERDMIYKIFTMGDISVKTFMRHRSLVASVAPSATKGEVRRVFAAGYSNLPVIDGNDVVGIIRYTALLFDDGTTPTGAVPPHDDDGNNDGNGSERGNDDEADFVRRHMTPPLFIPETHTASAVKARFEETGADFAIVLDEQGGFSGIVTMDCLARVVFARMADDNLSPAPSPLDRVRIISGEECIIPGDIKIADANELLGSNWTSDNFTTMGGWLLEQFGYLPSIGEVYTAGAMAFVVEDQERRRILSIRVKKIQHR